MITIDEAYVESAAPNPEAMKNGRGLVVKGKFLALNVDADETILFGKCQGSGKEPYTCSSDFQRPEQPTHRCTYANISPMQCLHGNWRLGHVHRCVGCSGSSRAST